jgi:ATP-dependent DNA helicase RecG
VAKMIIEKNKVVFENANIPHSYGELNPSNFTPYPKNPNIAKIFREIGFADELGSGVKNLYKYSKAYGGSDPLIVEGEIFRIEVQTRQETAQEAAQETAHENTKDKILELLRQNPKYTKADLMEILGKADGTIKEHISNLKKEGKLERIGSTKSGYWKVKQDAK